LYYKYKNDITDAENNAYVEHEGEITWKSDNRFIAVYIQNNNGGTS
jgi:hypothetical protein